MAEASVTLKLTPSEFDTIRRALKTHVQVNKDDHASEVNNGKERREAGIEAGRTQDLIDRLG